MYLIELPLDYDALLHLGTSHEYASPDMLAFPLSIKFPASISKPSCQLASGKAVDRLIARQAFNMLYKCGQFRKVCVETQQ